MNCSEKMYEEICEKLSLLSGRQDMITQMRNHINLEYSDSLNKLNADFEKKLNYNKEQEMRILAFMDIAKAHAMTLEDSGESEIYDTGVLSKLMVQINNGSQNDYFAGKLFEHSSCQLRYIKTELQEIYSWYENQKLNLEKLLHEKKLELDKKEKVLLDEVNAFLNSKLFEDFIGWLKDDAFRFDKCNFDETTISIYEEISIGIKRVKLPIPNEFDTCISIASQNLYDTTTKTIGVPVGIKIKDGEGVLVEYRNENELEVLNGIQNFILNILKYSNEYKKIIYIDPVRYNSSSLGVLQPLSVGENSIIDNVPLSIEEIRKKLNSLIKQININERELDNKGSTLMPKRLLVLHNFPHAYDSAMIGQIQQLFVNANHYNITIIATHNISFQSNLSLDTIGLIKTVAKCIKCNGLVFEIEDLYGTVPFKWYKAPQFLPQALKIKYIDNKPILNMESNYEERIGMESKVLYKKGIRRLENIPYGIDSNGSILTLDFENSNFATFICGASRSGKSTLLHTLITGLIKNNHPDDIEMWLIDFKMTEFSRYTNCLPPHVRYIILDESPELVYDIIDRLTEILIKRQNVFKGKWQKLDDVSKDKYMPAILVIIDEFSVMSQIVADSIVSSKDNYSIKLQTLLAKGAALGLHFIFASQGFTSGTRGLNDFSKKQIQQRIAMKTEYNEIKETLDLKSASDEDRAMMEQLPIHQALVRIPVDDRGNHLKQAKILYIDDYKKQENLINNINSTIHTAPRYDVDDPSIYIDKKSLIVDGANYSAFFEKKDSMIEYITKRKELYDYDEVVLFLGEPRRMLPLYPITLYNGFCENILIMASISEKMATASIIMSIIQSLKLVNKGVDIWATKRNEVYRQVLIESKQKVENVFNELGEVCLEIKRIKRLIENKIEGDKYIFILGAETLMLDMSYKSLGNGGGSNEHIPNDSLSMTIEKRKPNEMDLNTLLASMIGEEKQEIEIGNEGVKEKLKILHNQAEKGKVEQWLNDEYDARADLKFIMTQGPRLGYHIIILFNTAEELEQSKIDMALCKHKILFRMAKADAIGIVGSSNANVVAELDDHSFRYSNGIDALSFRPYLHPGLSWNGWSINGNIATSEDNEEYLM